MLPQNWLGLVPHRWAVSWAATPLGGERGFSAPKTRLPLIGQGGSGRKAVRGILPAGQEELV